MRGCFSFAGPYAEQRYLVKLHALIHMHSVSYIGLQGHCHAQAGQKLDIPARTAVSADPELIFYIIALRHQFLANTGMDIYGVIILPEGHHAIVRVEVQEQSPGLQHPLPLPVSLHHIRQSPGKVAGDHRIEGLPCKAEGLGIFLAEFHRAASCQGILLGLMEHLSSGHIHPGHLMPQL